MVRSVESGASLPLASVMKGSTRVEDSFEQELASAISQTIAGMGPGGGRFEVRVEEAGDGPSSGSRRFTVTVSPLGMVSSSAAAGLDAGPRPRYTAADLRAMDSVPANTLSYRDYEDPIPALTEQLRQMGVDPSPLQFELVDDVNNTIGGSMTNHLIRTTFPGGRVENFAIEWTLRNPKITAVEIQRLLHMA